MKYLFLFLLYSTNMLGQTAYLKNVRHLFQKSSLEEKSCNELIVLLELLDEKKDPILLGYKGVATMIKAKYVLNPFKKLSYFKKGKTMLENAISEKEDSIELRLLRLGVQKNAPSYLNYNKEVNKDKAFLKLLLPNVTDHYLREHITTFIEI